MLEFLFMVQREKKTVQIYDHSNFADENQTDINHDDLGEIFDSVKSPNSYPLH